MRKLLLALLCASSCFAVGNVQQSISQLGQTDNWVLAFRWQGDASTGTVPTTAAQLHGCCQGYIFSTVELVPGSPTPTSGYNVFVNTANGTDILAGAGRAASNSTAQAIAANGAAPPNDGTFSLVITGQSVASAKGAVFVYLSKPTTLNLALFRIMGGSIYRAQRAGVITVYPPPIQDGVAVVVSPKGFFIDTTGTTTSGLQEAEDARYASGYDMYIVGGDEPSGCSPGPSCGPVVYQMTSTLAFHPMQGNNIESGAITINCKTSIAANPCIQFDSLEIVNVRFPGSQVVTAGTGPAVLFKPTNAVPQDPLFTGSYADFYLWAAVNVHTPASDTASVPLIDFNMDAAPITYSTFTFMEVNGSGIGIRVKDPAAGKSFTANRIVGNFVHSQFGGANKPVVQVGQTAAGGALIGNNTWTLFIAQAGGTNTGPGVDTYEQWGTYHLNSNNGLVSYGIYFEPSAAAGNSVLAGQLGGATLLQNNISAGGDLSKNKLFITSEQGPKALPTIPGASPWLYQNTTGQPMVVTVSGGTVSLISLSTEGSNILATGLTSGAFTLLPGMYIRITYSVAPDVNVIV